MKRPLRNIVVLTLGDAGSRFIGFFITIYLARVLEPGAFGIVNIGTAVLAYLGLAASPGVQVLETRNIAMVSAAATERVESVLSLRLVLALFLLVLLWVFLPVLFTAQTTRTVVFAYALSLIPLSLFLDWYFQGKELFQIVSGAKLLQSGIYALGAFWLVQSAADVVLTAVAFGLGTAAATGMLLLVFISRNGRLSFRWDPKSWKRILNDGVPVGIAMFLGQNATNLPALVLAYVASTYEVGIYSAAMKLIILALLLDRVLNALLLPAATRYFSAGAGNARLLVSATAKAVAILILPIAACGIAAADILVYLVFGDGYAAASGVLRMLIGYFVLTLLNSVFVCILIGAGKEREYTGVMMRGVVVTGIAVVILSLWLGMIGAAAGVVIGELATVLMMMRPALRLSSLSAVDVFGRIVVTATLMGVSLFVLQETGVVISSGVTLVLFGLCGIFLKLVDREEIRFLRERFV